MPSGRRVSITLVGWCYSFAGHPSGSKLPIFSGKGRWGEEPAGSPEVTQLNQKASLVSQRIQAGQQRSDFIGNLKKEPTLSIGESRWRFELALVAFF